MTRPRLLRPQLVGALLLCACAGGPPAGGPRPYPGELVPPGELPGAVLLRQRVEARFPGRPPARFEAVVQKKGDALLVIGLGPMATRSFTIALRGREVSAEYRAPEARALPPGHLLQDVQRAFFRGLPGPLPDGEHAAADRGEELTERWAGGRLLERRFRRDDAPGELRLTYQGGWTPGERPPPVELANGWLEYALGIETLEARPLGE